MVRPKSSLACTPCSRHSAFSRPDQVARSITQFQIGRIESAVRVQKGSQYFIRLNNEALSVAVCVKRDYQRNRLRDAPQPVTRCCDSRYDAASNVIETHEHKG